MLAGEFAREFKAIIEKIRVEQNVESIQINDLIAYLNEISQFPDGEMDATSFERYRAELQVWVERNKEVHAARVESFKSVILAGQNAIRTAFLMNGGAAVALLAFLGALSSTNPNQLKVFAPSLLIFTWGVFFVGLTSGFTYLCQWFYGYEAVWSQKVGFILNILCIVIGLSSFGLFICGAFTTYSGFLAFA